MADAVTESFQLSNYHFNVDRIDPRYDGIQALGHFSGDWNDEIQVAIESSKSVSFATRGDPTLNAYENPPPRGYTNLQDEDNYNTEKEFFDNKDVGYEDDGIINKSLVLGPKLQKMLNLFQLTGPLHYTVHIQKTGQVFPDHIDFFHRRSRLRDQPQDKIIRIMIMLTDWVPGHFMHYGNYVYTHWKAGDFHTFAHSDVPHGTANSSYTPRVMLMITGVKSDATEEFLYRAKTSKEIEI